jgi:hypothetical protein
MSNMSQLAAELQEAQEQAWDAAMVLEQKLGAISEILWQGDDMVPMFSAPKDLLVMLQTIQTELAAPMAEIEGSV